MMVRCIYTCRAPLGTLYEKFGFSRLTFNEMPAYFRRIARLAALLRWLHLVGDELLVMRLSDSGAKAWLFREVSEASLGAIIKVDLAGEAFAFDLDERALSRARLNDGKLLLVTNVTDLQPHDIVGRYKSLADIERGFKVLKSDIEIAPVFHRLPERIKAHALICFLALVLHRVLRMQLKDAHSPYSPQRALQIAQRIQFHQVTVEVSVARRPS